jgi:uncharacterized protein (TIGR03663 family)
MREKTSEQGTGFLDKPVFGVWKITWWHVIYAALMVFIFCTRLWALSTRGYEHDESIHAWESWKLATGQSYRHDPVYHGPFLYHITALLFLLFGDNDLTGRLGATLGGIAITIMPLFLRKWLGKKGVLLTTALMAISPVLMARSRYIWHDQWAIVFNLLMFIAILRYVDERKTRDLYLAVAGLVLGYTGKSTTFITLAILWTFMFGVYIWQWLRERGHPWNDSPLFDLMLVLGTLTLPMATPLPVKILGGNPVDYSQQGIIFSGAVFIVLLATGAAIGLWWDWRHWLVCAGIFYGIFIPLFTTLFTNGNGFATGMVGMLGYWLTQQAVKRGSQPAHYYLMLMSLYEFLPSVIGIGGTIYYLLRGDPGVDQLQSTPIREGVETRLGGEEAKPLRSLGIPFVPLVIYWSALAFVAYTIAGEKMPWLTLHLVVPLDLLAGWTLARLFDANWKELRARGGLWLLLVVPLFVYALIALVRGRPTTGTSTQDLQQTMAWVSSLVIGAIMLVSIWRILSRLSGKDSWRMLSLSLLTILTAATIRFAWMVTFINAGFATELLVYAQGTPDDALVARELESMSRRLVGDLSMKVAYDDEVSWPFVWYLRNFTNAQFYGKKPGGPFDAEVVLVGTNNEAGVKPFLGNKYYRRQYRLIWWPNQDWYMDWTPKKLWDIFKDPVSRKKFWDVVWSRKYDASPTAWPYVNTFAMYVRRDVAQQLWDYGPETIVAAGPLPGDEYVEKWKQVSAIATWGSVGNQLGQMRNPKGIAFDDQGNLYVADSQNHRIQVFDPNGQLGRQWGGEGTQPGQFKEPWGVAVAKNGDVYVADTWNHRIQVFDAEGNFKTMWGLFGESGEAAGPGTALYGPRDLAFDSKGFLYVSDTGNKRIVKYDPQGNMVAGIGGTGDGEGQMQEPVGIALDKDDNLYIADTWNQRIQVFDSQLNFLRQWPVLAWEGMSVVNKPYLALDEAGNVYITDPEGFRVLKFDSQGKLLAAWGQSGNDLSSMNLPTGIKVDKAGRVVIADSDNHRILIFAGQQAP